MLIKSDKDIFYECFKDVCQEKIIELSDENESLRKEISEVESDLKLLKESTITSIVKLFGKVWTNSIPKNNFEKDIFVDDPIYGQLSIPKEIVPIFNQPIIRRLNYVKQLSFGYLTYPTATHSRLSHCLGVARNAVKSLQNMFSKGYYYSEHKQIPINLEEEEKRYLLLKTFLAGLLHDLGHGPFGHALDRYIAYHDPTNNLPKPDKRISIIYIKKYLNDILNDCKFNVDEIIFLLDPSKTLFLKGWDSLISEIIDSAIDADRMDYLLRDSHLTGLTVGSINIDALIERMIPFSEKSQIRLLYDYSVMPYVENFLYARDSMFILCYEEETKLYTERALTRFIQEIHEQKLIKLDELLLLTDDQLMNIGLHLAPVNLTYAKMFKELLLGTGFFKIVEIKASKEINKNPSSELQSWWEYRENEEYTTALLDKPLEWENHISKKCGIEKWQVIISVPSDEVYPDEQIRARVLKQEGGKFIPTKIIDESDTIKDFGEQLSKSRQLIKVFVSSNVSIEKREEVKEVSLKLFEK